MQGKEQLDRMISIMKVKEGYKKKLKILKSRLNKNKRKYKTNPKLQ